MKLSSLAPSLLQGWSLLSPPQEPGNEASKSHSETMYLEAVNVEGGIAAHLSSETPVTAE